MWTTILIFYVSSSFRVFGLWSHFGFRKGSRSTKRYFLVFSAVSFICKYVKCFLNKIKYWKSYLKPEIYIFFVACLLAVCGGKFFCFVAFSCSQIYVDYFRGFLFEKAFWGQRWQWIIEKKRIWREILILRLIDCLEN